MLSIFATAPLLFLVGICLQGCGDNGNSPSPADTAPPIELCPIPKGTIPSGTSPWKWPLNDEATRSTRNTGKYKVLLVRHAESIANTFDTLYVKSCTTSLGFAGCNHTFDPRDTPLSENGIRTAKQQGQSKTLASLDTPDVILVSPMLRTMQTAMNVIPEAWLQQHSDKAIAPKIYFMPLVTECSAQKGSIRSGGVWAQPAWQNWGHTPSTWFNASCPVEIVGATLDYNHTRATCVGYQSIEKWVKQYVNSSSSDSYNGFYSKAWFDFWSLKETSMWSPSGKQCVENVNSVWKLLNEELKDSKVLIVTHHQFLRTLISWPSNTPDIDPFFGHVPPSFLCSKAITI